MHGDRNILYKFCMADDCKCAINWVWQWIDKFGSSSTLVSTAAIFSSDYT